MTKHEVEALEEFMDLKFKRYVAVCGVAVEDNITQSEVMTKMLPIEAALERAKLRLITG